MKLPSPVHMVWAGTTSTACGYLSWSGAPSRVTRVPEEVTCEPCLKLMGEQVAQLLKLGGDAVKGKVIRRGGRQVHMESNDPISSPAFTLCGFMLGTFWLQGGVKTSGPDHTLEPEQVTCPECKAAMAMQVEAALKVGG